MRSIVFVFAACATPAASPPTNTSRGDHVEPVIETPEPTEGCTLRWDELHAPARIPLHRVGTTPGDDCPTGFDPAAVLAPNGCTAPDCITAKVASGRAHYTLDGPAGSGHFANFGIVVEGIAPTFACGSMSTVGWRLLSTVGKSLAPIPWFADLDGDGTHEVISWQRLPWGHSEVSNGMWPVIYSMEADALVRRDDKRGVIGRKVAGAYRELARLEPTDEWVACYLAIAKALD
jgi:hypothetical protein